MNRQTKVYRGPVRAKRKLIGSPSYVPVPISSYAPRLQGLSEEAGKFAPSTDKANRKFAIKVSGAT